MSKVRPAPGVETHREVVREVREQIARGETPEPFLPIDAIRDGPPGAEWFTLVLPSRDGTQAVVITLRGDVVRRWRSAADLIPVSAILRADVIPLPEGVHMVSEDVVPVRLPREVD